MKRANILPKAVLIYILIFSIIPTALMSSCAQNTETQAKASPALLAQVALRQQQLSKPSSENITQMQSLGMNVESISVQRIYIYSSQPLTGPQTDELKSLGVTVYADSWIPPVGNHPQGFILADMPVDKLDAVANKTYIIKLDTAETYSEPQTNWPQ